MRKIIIGFVAILMLAGAAQAEWHYNGGALPDDDWTNVANWGGNDPGTYPGGTAYIDWVVIDQPTLPGPTVYTDLTVVNGVMYSMYFPNGEMNIVDGGVIWSLLGCLAAPNAGDNFTVNVYGGSFNIGWRWWGGFNDIRLGTFYDWPPSQGGTGTLNVSGGEVNTYDRHIMVGYNRGGVGEGTGVLNQSDGTITIWGYRVGTMNMLWVGASDPDHSSGTVNLSGGLLVSKGMPLIGDTGVINITGGTLLTVDYEDEESSAQADLEAYMDAGKIRGYCGCTDPACFEFTKISPNPDYYPGTFDTISVQAIPPIEMNLDILPDDDPNLFTVNTQGKGRLPMAILASEEYDISEIDVNSISIAGTVFPVKAPHLGDDLVIHVSRRELILALGLDTMEPGTIVPVTVQGLLMNGPCITATDTIELVARGD
jgi:hypothetical protein